MGKLSKLLFLSCLMVSMVCLAAGFWLAGWWEAAFIPGVALLLCFLFRGRIGTWVPSALLVLYLLMAGQGVLAGVPPAWMIVGLTAALASWDLAQFRIRLRNPGRADRMILFERRHVQSLGMALGLGLLLALAGLFLRIQLPFGFFVLVILLTLASLDRFHRSVFVHL